nr:immunoglobulin light chain junction region [Macaca mulatta]MOW27922.1 immunoglobulin light chain junction region [Macaca mulatta]MOW28225.1 immunoglobulin light chain junction region [Macaca mulatta]MOW28406.1 immunoglobulin light chain junction region [Macaca mulatta]MOW28626.1 immunoglobulin light chain junction region [Macaca mulatta]
DYYCAIWHNSACIF